MHEFPRKCDSLSLPPKKGGSSSSRKKKKGVESPRKERKRKAETGCCCRKRALHTFVSQKINYATISARFSVQIYVYAREKRRPSSESSRLCMAAKIMTVGAKWNEAKSEREETSECLLSRSVTNQINSRLKFAPRRWSFSLRFYTTSSQTRLLLLRVAFCIHIYIYI